MNAKKTLVWNLVVCLFAVTTSLLGQDSDYGIFQTQQEYYEFMGSVKTEGENNPELMAMVPMINDIVLGQPIGTTGKRYNATNSTLGLLSSDSIRKELEMVDEQYEDLKKANDEIQQRVAEQLKGLDLSNMKSATEQILAIRDQSEKDLQSTLLPHQIKRLRQIAAQNQLRYRSLVEILTSEPMKSEFDISDKQGDQLKQAETEIQQQLERQIAELRAKARKKLLSRLKQDQQDEIEEWFGDTFEFEFPAKAESSQKKQAGKNQNWKK